MDLNDYLKIKKERPSVWAKKNGIDPATLSRFFSGKQSLSLETARIIVEATNGSVDYSDLTQKREDHDG